MRVELVRAMGKRAFVQSLKPYRATKASGVRIFGLDTEYVPREGKASELLTWQLAGENRVVVHKRKKLNIASLYEESEKMLSEVEGEVIKTLVYVTYFSLAEIQFFDLTDWIISEFKGKYKLKQHFNGKVMSIIDLADWYPGRKLEEVAKMWGEKKAEYPIGEKVEAIAAGKLTRAELLADPKFMNYARRSIVPGEKVLYTILQPEIRARIVRLFGMSLFRTISTSHLVILTDRQLIIIKDENPGGWGDDSRYGGIWNYIPLDKIASVSLAEKGGNLLTLSIHLPQDDQIDTLFSVSNEQEVELFLNRLGTLISGK